MVKDIESGTDYSSPKNIVQINDKVYFEAYQSTPSFYLKSGENSFRIDCDVDDIKVLPITETHKMDTYLKDKCCCISSKASCWAKAIYYTSRSDKPPFDEM